MRAIYLAVIAVVFAAIIATEAPALHKAPPMPSTVSEVLLAQQIAEWQNAVPQQRATVPNASAQSKSNHAATGNKSPATAQPPATTPEGPTMPWLGAPPQFQKTWPPAVMPQSDQQDDLQLIQPPRKPPKIHQA